MCLISVLCMNRPELNTILFSRLLQYRHILRIERTLACIVQNISLLIYMRMFGTFFEPWCVRLLIKCQIPELNTVIRLIRNGKTLVFQKLRISQERLLFYSTKNAYVSYSLTKEHRRIPCVSLNRQSSAQSGCLMLYLIMALTYRSPFSGWNCLGKFRFTP